MEWPNTIVSTRSRPGKADDDHPQHQLEQTGRDQNTEQALHENINKFVQLQNVFIICSVTVILIDKGIFWKYLLTKGRYRKDLRQFTPFKPQPHTPLYDTQQKQLESTQPHNHKHQRWAHGVASGTLRLDPTEPGPEGRAGSWSQQRARVSTTLIVQKVRQGYQGCDHQVWLWVMFVSLGQLNIVQYN